MQSATGRKIALGDIEDKMRHNSTLLKTQIANHPHYNWRLFYLLWGLASFGLLAGLPYVLALQKDNLQAIHLPLPLPALISVQVVIQFTILGLLTGIGLWLAEKIGLGSPILSNWLAGNPVKQVYRYTWLPVVLIGLAVSAIVVFLDTLVFSPIIQHQLQLNGLNLPSTINPPIWEGLLASFYGGFTEEILIRLFLMSLLAWLGNRLLRNRSHQPSNGIMWSANILAALAFGLGHLPTAIAIGLPLNAMGITRILLLNGLPGIVFGWLYWKRGLESSMIAHFSGDILIHVITPWLLLS
jgi:hypothetical protein